MGNLEARTPCVYCTKLKKMDDSFSCWVRVSNSVLKLRALHRATRSPFYSKVIGLVHFTIESEDNVTANTSILEQPITVNSCSSKFSSISFENLENVSKMLT